MPEDNHRPIPTLSRVEFNRTPAWLLKMLADMFSELPAKSKKTRAKIIPITYGKVKNS